MGKWGDFIAENNTGQRESLKFSFNEARNARRVVVFLFTESAKTKVEID